MSATLLTGWSGLLVGYATAGVPMLAGLIRERAPLRKLLLSPALAVPVTIAAGVGNGLVGSLLHGLGASSGGFLELMAGIGVTATVGYFSGRAIPRHGSDTSPVRRGTVIDEIEEGSDHTNRRTNEHGAEAENVREAGSDAGARHVPLTLCGVRIPPGD